MGVRNFSIGLVLIGAVAMLPKASATEFIDATLPLGNAPLRVEVAPFTNKAAVNEFLTVQWTVGPNPLGAGPTGEIRASGPGCATPGTTPWRQVQGSARGAGRLEIPQHLAHCQTQFCLKSQQSDGTFQESCFELALTAPQGWLKLRANVAEVAVGQEVSLHWESDRLSSLNGTVAFTGASCAFNGQTRTWEEFFSSGALGGNGLQFREGPENLAHCRARYCLRGKSLTDGSAITDCAEVQYQPAIWRAQHWVRDSRYLYDPTLRLSPHITWSVRGDPDWIATTTEVALGTAPGRADLVGWTPTQGESGVRFRFQPGRVTYGQLYFASVRLRDAFGRTREISANGWRYLRNEDWPRTAPQSPAQLKWTNESLHEVVEDDTVGIHSLQDVDRVRGTLIRQLWPREGRLPVALPEQILDEPSVYQALIPIIGEQGAPHQVDAPELPQLLEGIADATSSLKRLRIRLPSGLESHAFWFHPRNNAVHRLAVVHQGHDDIAGTFGGGRSTLFFLKNGFDVVLFFMPASGPNEESFRAVMNQYRAVLPLPDGTRPYHNDWFELARRLPPQALGEHPMAAYLSPIRIALNYLTRNFDFHDITMIGCSGGGWSTTLYAALDPQIKYSFPVAGSLPIPLRRYRPVDLSDAEQHAPDIYSIAGYRDLYAMATAGKGAGRVQVQILNGNDSCCFRPSSPAANDDPTYVIPYTNIFEKYERQVSQAATDFGGQFRVAVDAPASHTISHWSLWSVVAPTLGLRPNMVITMNGQEGGRDGNARTRIRGDSNLRYEWSCPNCTGALRAGYSFGGCAPTSTNNPIDWIKGPKGFFEVPGSPNRIGCWIDLTLATEGSPVRSTTHFDWVAPSDAPPRGAPTLQFKMNGLDGSRIPSEPTAVRGDVDLVYEWHCQHCQAPPRVRYSFGGNCGRAGTLLPVEWVNTLQGRQFVRGSSGRLDCWIRFHAQLDESPEEHTFSFNWVP